MSYTAEDWDKLRRTLTGASKQLAFQCDFERLEHGCIQLTAPISQKPLVIAFGDKLREQIGLKELGLMIEFRG
jgi:hypothetical protein